MPSYHHGNLTAAVKEAALQQLKEGELSKLSMRALGREVGVSAPALYRHFASREALLATLAADGYRLRTARTREAIDQMAAKENATFPRPAVARFLETGVHYVLFAHEHPGYYSVMNAPELCGSSEHPILRDAIAESSELLMASIGECQEQGFLLGSDARDIAAAAWASVHGLTGLLLGGQLRGLGYDDGCVEETVRRVLGALIGALDS